MVSVSCKVGWACGSVFSFQVQILLCLETYFWIVALFCLVMNDALFCRSRQSLERQLIGLSNNWQQSKLHV